MKKSINDVIHVVVSLLMAGLSVVFIDQGNQRSDAQLYQTGVILLPVTFWYLVVYLRNVMHDFGK